MNGSSLGRRDASSTQRHNAGDLGQARSSHPSLPLQDKFSDEESSRVQGQHGWLGSCYVVPASVQWLPRWPVPVQAGKSPFSSRWPHSFFGYQMVWSRSGCLLERLKRRRGRDDRTLWVSSHVLHPAHGSSCCTACAAERGWCPPLCHFS